MSLSQDSFAFFNLNTDGVIEEIFDNGRDRNTGGSEIQNLILGYAGV
jgi:hypothetical protein